jgi:NAD-dependent DNA ligase
MTATDRYDADLLMAARFAYYVRHLPFLSDQAYDALEREYEAAHPRLPVGSEDPADYTPAQRALALYFLLSQCEPDPTPLDNPEDML